MEWNRLLWGVKFSSGMKSDEPMLISTAWMIPMPKSPYDGAPSRPILFTTRAQARAWCKSRMETYKHRSGCCTKWKFQPVRVREIVYWHDP